MSLNVCASATTLGSPVSSARTPGQRVLDAHRLGQVVEGRQRRPPLRHMGNQQDHQPTARIAASPAATGTDANTSPTNASTRTHAFAPKTRQNNGARKATAHARSFARSTWATLRQRRTRPLRPHPRSGTAENERRGADRLSQIAPRPVRRRHGRRLAHDFSGPASAYACGPAQWPIAGRRWVWLRGCAGHPVARRGEMQA